MKLLYLYMKSKKCVYYQILKLDKEGYGFMIKKVGVVGCGAMGSGIVQVAAAAGYDVTALEVSQEFLDKGLERIKAFTDKSIERGKLTAEGQADIFAKIKGTTEYADLADCDMVIEAVIENADEKKKVFAKLDEVVREDVILATNTSSLSVLDIAASSKVPSRVVGIHFFNPVQLMKLVEVIKTILVNEKYIAVSRDFINTLGKTSILAKDYPGFICNYLQYPFRLNAIRMVERGMASVEDIDAAAKLGLGHPMGPLELQDMVGLDVTYSAVTEVYNATKDPVFAPPVLMAQMVAAGHLGRKTGKGFYDYKTEK